MVGAAYSAYCMCTLTTAECRMSKACVALQPIAFLTADDVLAVSEDGKYIKRKIKYQRLSAAEQGFCKATKAVEIGLQLASGSAHGGVLLPVDVRLGKLSHVDQGSEHSVVVTAVSMHGKTDDVAATTGERCDMG